MSRGLREDLDCDLGEWECVHRAEPVSSATFAEDTTGNRAAEWVRVSCGVDSRVFRVEDFGGRAGGRGVDLSDDTCNELLATCGLQPTKVSFLDDAGNELASHIESGGLSDCTTLGVRLEEECDPRVFVPIETPNQTASSTLGLECPPGPECYRIFRDVEGEAQPLATVCEDELPICFDGFLVDEGGITQVAECDGTEGTRVSLPNLGGEPICLSVAIVNDNNIHTTKWRYDCVTTHVPTPGPPQVLQFHVRARHERRHGLVAAARAARARHADRVLPQGLRGHSLPQDRVLPAQRPSRGGRGSSRAP